MRRSSTVGVIIRELTRLYKVDSYVSGMTLTCRKLLHTTGMRRDRDGTVAERKQERQRRSQEVQVFNELADLRQAKDKATFMKAIEIYHQKQSVYKRGHVDFIEGSLEQMKAFQVHKDIEVYKELMKVFPEGELVAKSIIQSEFMHFPRQQNTGLEILTAMANNAVIPDDEMGALIISRFGKNSYVMKKYRRMMYWMPKFRHMNPYPVPLTLPRSSVELAVLALKRMAVDKRNEVEVYSSSELESYGDDTFIASATSPSQRQLMKEHKPERPLFVEGGYIVWLKDENLVYFTLRSDPRPELLEYERRLEEEDRLDVSSGFFSFIGEDDEEKRKTALLANPSIHEQPEGTILAMCITGTSSKDSLMSWINFLQKENPCLAKVPIVFSLRTPESGVQTVDYTNAPDGPGRIESGPT